MKPQFTPGQSVSVTVSGNITKYGSVQRLTENTVYVKHFNGSVVGYKPELVTATVIAEHQQRPYGVGLSDEISAIQSIMEKTLTPAEKKKREEVAQAIERDNPDMPMDKKMAIATATAKKVAEAYSGKNPDHIKTVTSAGAGNVVCTTNAGAKHTVSAKDTGGKMPKPGEHIGKYVKEAVEQTHPKTDKEKALAKLAPPHDKITHADVLTGRGVKKEEAGENLPGQATHLTNKDLRQPGSEYGIISRGTTLRHLGGNKYEVRAGRARGKHMNIDSEHVQKLAMEGTADQLDELSVGTLQSYRDKTDKRMKDLAKKMDAAWLAGKHDKDASAEHERTMRNNIRAAGKIIRKSFEEEAALDEARVGSNFMARAGQRAIANMRRAAAERDQGTHPSSEREKDLAAAAHPKDKITHKDVLVKRGAIKEGVEITPTEFHAVRTGKMTADDLAKKKNVHVGTLKGELNLHADHWSQGEDHYNSVFREEKIPTDWMGVPTKLPKGAKPIKPPAGYHDYIKHGVKYGFQDDPNHPLRKKPKSDKSMVSESDEIELTEEDIADIDAFLQSEQAELDEARLMVSRHRNFDFGDGPQAHEITKDHGTASDGSRVYSVKQPNGFHGVLAVKDGAVVGSTHKNHTQAEAHKIGAHYAKHGTVGIGVGSVWSLGSGIHGKVVKESLEEEVGSDQSNSKVKELHHYLKNNPNSKVTGVVRHRYGGGVMTHVTIDNKYEVRHDDQGAKLKSDHDYAKRKITKSLEAGRLSDSHIEHVKEEVVIKEAMISYSDFQSKIDAHKKAGNKIKDDKYDKNKASYTVIDQDGVGKKITHTPSGTKQDHLGQVEKVKDVETQTTEKRGRGRPAGSKSGARN